MFIYKVIFLFRDLEKIETPIPHLLILLSCYRTSVKYKQINLLPLYLQTNMQKLFFYFLSLRYYQIRKHENYRKECE